MPLDNHYGRKAFGEVVPQFGELTDRVLFGEVWTAPGLSLRERSLVTVATLIALNRTAQLPFHFARARDNGVARDALAALITHLAFYAGWPVAASASDALRDFDASARP